MITEEQKDLLKQYKEKAFISSVLAEESYNYYNFENFIEQVNLAEALTSSDMGVSCGLISQSFWETFRYYYVNIERSAMTDKHVARNINISFTNNSLVPIDVLIFIIYSSEFVIDVETGLIKTI